MGTVINFLDIRRSASTASDRPHLGPAAVIVLPVVRIERKADGVVDELAPEADSPQSGGRRRRGRRP